MFIKHFGCSWDPPTFFREIPSWDPPVFWDPPIFLGSPSFLGSPFSWDPPIFWDPPVFLGSPATQYLLKKLSISVSSSSGSTKFILNRNERSSLRRKIIYLFISRLSRRGVRLGRWIPVYFNSTTKLLNMSFQLLLSLEINCDNFLYREQVSLRR